MEKTKEYLQKEYDRYCDKFWATDELITNKKKEILKLEGEIKSLEEIMNEYNDKRNTFSEMLDEIIYKNKK